jgi:hypothetical protein
LPGSVCFMISPSSASNVGRKLQNNIKAIVKQFGELLLRWKDLTKQISLLSESLNSLQETSSSISQTTLQNPFWNYIMADFNDACERILFSINVDVDLNFLNLRECL